MLGRRIVTALGVAIVALPWGFAVHKMVSPRPVKVDEMASSLVWGDRVFSSPRPMAGWLSARGYRYRPWASLHPQAVAILTHRPFRPPVLAGATPTKSPKAIPTAGSGLVSKLKAVVEILLLALAFVILAASATPGVVLSRAPPRMSYTLQAYRAYFATGAITILLGYAVQTL